MKKDIGKSITYNPCKSDVFGETIGTLIIAIMFVALVDHSLSVIICTTIFVLVELWGAYLALRYPGYATSATIDREGVHITFEGKDEPLFAPWSKDVYVNICVEDHDVTRYQLARRKILCLSNYDINGEYLSYEGKMHCINMLHKFPDDDNEVWVLFLVTDTKGACKRAAKKVSAFKDAALSGERDIRE